MSNKAKTFLILSCVFVTIAALLSALHLYLSYGTYSLIFTHAENLGEALGVVFGLIVFIAYSLLLGIGILVSGGLTLGFVIPLMKIEGKKWYSIAIMVVAIVAIALAILAFVMIPVVSDAHSAASSSSSSSSEPISESAALLLQLL
jgi:hypothetical protein